MPTPAATLSSYKCLCSPEMGIPRVIKVMGECRKLFYEAIFWLSWEIWVGEDARHICLGY